MSEGRESAEEELLREAALVPRLSPALRERVLKSARRAHRRRQLIRESIGAAMFLLLAAWAGSWYGDSLLPGPPRAGRDSERDLFHANADHSASAAGGVLANGARPVRSSAGDDWEEVEAASQIRERKSNVLEAAF